MWNASALLIYTLLIVDAFFVSYAIGLNSRHVLVVDGSLPVAAIRTTTTTTTNTPPAPVTATAVAATSAAPSAPVINSKVFSDLALAPPHLQGVLNQAAEAALLEATADKKFRPNDPVTRAQFTQWLMRVRQSKPATPVAATYSDVATDDPPSYKDIEGATAANLVEGVDVKGSSRKSFQPLKPVTREDFAVMYGIFSGKNARVEEMTKEEEERNLRFDPNKSTVGTITYKDEGDIDESARKSVALAQRAGVLEQAFEINPYDESKEKRYLHPHQNLSRAEAVNILVKLYGLPAKSAVE